MTNLRDPVTYSFETPPVGFDPTHATPDEVVRFGLLPLPELDSSIEYRQFWEMCVARDVTFVDPPCFVPYKTEDFSVTATQPAPTARVRNDHWSGLAVDSGHAPLAAAWCTCTIPSLSMPQSIPRDGQCLNSVWVGLDGWANPQTDILQIGVDFYVRRKNGDVKTEIHPWCEWWQMGNCYFDLPTSEGDTIALAVSCDHRASTGIVYMINVTTKQMYRRKVQACTGVTMLGNCAEWILERQTYRVGDDAPLTSLCQFGSITIDHASASTSFPPKGSSVLHAGDGTPVDMVNTTDLKPERQIVIARTTVLGPQKLQIDRLNANTPV